MGRNGWWNNFGGGWGGGRKKKPKKQRFWQRFNFNRNEGFDLDLGLFGLERLNRPTTSTAEFSYLATPPVVNYEEILDLEEETDDEILFGSLRGNIVGIQYYKGTVNDGEMVSLVREPQNPYDPNAVKVNNVDSIQVGHIKRELARALSTVLDNNLGRVEGIVPFGSTNVYTMPVDLTLWGKRENKEAAISKMKTLGFLVREPKEVGVAPDTAVAGFNHELDTRRVFLSPVEMKGQLDKLFENLKEGDKTSLAEPAEAIVTKLYPHQKQALHWMIGRENNNTLPPFWENKRGQYFNSITVFTTNRKPKSVYGGILADDMGLGKTLEMIALILTNFEDGKPLAVPVRGVVREPKKQLKRSKSASAGRKSSDTPGFEVTKKKVVVRKKLRLIRPGGANDLEEAPPLPKLDPALIPEPEESEEETEMSENEEIPEDNLAENVMLKAEDPEYKPELNSPVVKADAPSPNVRSRPRRSSRKPAKYRFSDSEENSDDDCKKPKVKQEEGPVTPSVKKLKVENAVAVVVKKAAPAKRGRKGKGRAKGKKAVVQVAADDKPDRSVLENNPDSVNTVPSVIEVSASASVKVTNNSATLSDKTRQPTCESATISMATDQNQAGAEPMDQEIANCHVENVNSSIVNSTTTDTCGPLVNAVTDASPGDNVTAEKKEKFEEPKSVTTCLPGGIVQRVLSDGTVETTFPSGVVQTILPSGTVKTKLPSKGVQTILPNSQVTVEAPMDVTECSQNSVIEISSEDLSQEMKTNDQGIKNASSCETVEDSKSKQSDGCLVSLGCQSTVALRVVDSQLASVPSQASCHKLNSVPGMSQSDKLSSSQSAGTCIASPTVCCSNVTPTALSVSASCSATTEIVQSVPTSKDGQLKGHNQLPSVHMSVKESGAKQISAPSCAGTQNAVASNTTANTSVSVKTESGATPSVSSPSKALFTKKLGTTLQKGKSCPPSLPSLPKQASTTPVVSVASCSRTALESSDLPDLSPSTSTHKPVLPVINLDDELPDLPDTEDVDGMKQAVTPCGKMSGRTISKGPRGTLIICPLSVMSNWINQLEAHLHENVILEVYMYYGSNRITDKEFLENQDIVLTTYSTVANDYKGKHTLRAVEWLRIVLDEGHTIRNPNAQMTKAVLELKAKRRWVLTGTPIQNSMKDLWSIINFLHISPFTDKQWWHRTIERPLIAGENSALKRVRHLMNVIAMRRTKTQEVNGKPLVQLPEKNVFVEHIKLGDDERKVYDAMQNNGQLVICKYFNQGTLLHHYGEVLAILMRLRQLCCHPQLVAKAAAAAAQALQTAQLQTQQPQAAGTETSREDVDRLVQTLMEVLQSGSDEECSICLDSLRRPVITPCAHVYCRTCIEAVIRNEQPHPHCPLCRGDLKIDQLVEVPEEQAPEKLTFSDADWQSSAKVDALMNALITLRQQDPTAKSLVVSQFTSLLTLLEIPLRKQGFVFSRLDGTMSAGRREESIDEFSSTEAGSPTIMLLSLKAGGVGINLTAASNVFLMDPAWNPASEEQCFDRCHRLGQTRDVTVTKFVIEDSVEERMLQLQEKKRQLMQGAFGGKISAEKRREQRINDIRNLINL